ncbi:hypothetical protein Trco_007313 [Trichoderma cornu-damae]|uniref:DUF6604 domain-containing protein n=1 Tax=Trichoderma cornu-damae TaxID=654480 RepID=A0A9P8QK90_9HYPO|nr:hypothetical protein Trco_007313 [Trichoderma cornu-damae]
MASIVPQNTYRTYKRDTQQLLFWIIHAFNTILQSPAAAVPGGDAHQNRQNVTGQVTVKELVAMAKTISKHPTRVPGAVYRKLQSVTRARTAVYQAFQQLAALNPRPDLEMEESNATHKYFIDALHEVFEVLGGPAWAREQQGETRSQATRAEGGKEAQLDAELDAEVEKASFSNKFAALGLGNSADGEPDAAAADSSGGEEESNVEPRSAVAGHQRRQSRPGRGKKRGGKRAKKSKQAANKPAHLTLDEVPLESYRIIEDADGIVTDYLLAVYALFEETCDLRLYMTGVWREVAYEGLNGAVAATLGDLATAIVKRAESAIMVEFPGHESYETAMRTITRGDIEKAQGNFTMALYRTGGTGGRAEKVEEACLDVKEQFLIYAYWDLVDFVTDFQATRSGKPTKRMLEEIDKWNPTLDLQHATKEQRHRWRRSYTINWLYDLVNVYSSIVVQRNTMKGEHHVYEKVDWAADGQWSQHVRLFGINEFAGIVTSLAMQKPGTDVKKLINPSLVFQLQCMVDSLMVSRGWSLSSFKGHVLEPPMSGFRPRRDVDLFLDRENRRFGTGFCQGSDVLKQLLGRDSMMHGNPNRHQAQIDVLENLMWDFRDWLGESKYMSGLTTLPPSRFSNSNSNGLWEFSPFLCGAGLAEGLELAYRFGLALWDQVPEPMLLIHLHNMLVQKKYLDRPIGLFASLESTFPTAFFVDGNPPTADFHQALSDQMGKTGTHFAQRQRAAKRKGTPSGIHGVLDVGANRFFNTKSNLLLYRESRWNPDRIPDGDLGRQTVLFNYRSQHSAAEASGQGTGKARTPNAGGPRPLHLGPDNDPAQALSQLPGPDHLSRRDLLELLRCDIYSDICGLFPYSSLNYVWVTARIISLFMMFEQELKKLGNPTYHEIYVANGGSNPEKRVFLAVTALSGKDEECVRTMARVMEDQRMGWMQHIYWEDLDTSMDRLYRRISRQKDDAITPDMCSVM